MRPNLATSVVSLVAATLLTACGGGSGGADTPGSPSVSTLSATTVMYSRTMTVTVNGNWLTQGDVNMIVEGPCGPVTRVNGGTDLQQNFTCKVTGVGDLIPRIRTAEGVELASLRLKVPLPQVQMTVTQSARSGSYIVELDPVAAPITVDNFLAYVSSGFYRNTIFHRVVSGFVVQAGGYIAGPTPKAATLPAITLESNNGLKNLRGTIAMARTSDPNSANAQFYLNLVDNPSLDYGSTESPEGYAVFGKIVSGLDSTGKTISGLDVMDEIGKVPVTAGSVSGLSHLPVSNVVLTAVSQIK